MSQRITDEMVRESVATDIGGGVTKDTVKILSDTRKKGSNIGDTRDNFNGEVAAVDVVSEVDGVKREHHFMFKCSPMSKSREQFIDETGSWDNEWLMYSVVLPEVANMWERNKHHSTSGMGGIGFPKVYYGNKKEGILVMENLKSSGYGMVDKKVGMQLDHVQAVLRQLCFVHTSSFDYINKFEGGLDAFKATYPSMCHDGAWLDTTKPMLKKIMDNLIGSVYGIFVKVIEDFSGDPDLIQRVKKFAGSIAETMPKIHQPEGNVVSLVHNDSWTNNFMFKRESENEPWKVKLIDFQLSRRARPCVDLAYFIGASTNEEFREKHLEDLLKYYHDKISGVLDIIGYDAKTLYSYDYFRKEFQECFPFGHIMAVVHAQVNTYIFTYCSFIFEIKPNILVSAGL